MIPEDYLVKQIALMQDIEKWLDRIVEQLERFNSNYEQVHFDREGKVRR